MPGTTVPAMAGWTCDVSVVATCAEASSVGISSTTLTTSASAISSATSCDGAMLNDSSRVLEDAMSDDCTGALAGTEKAARASNGELDATGALVVSGVGEPLPLFDGRAGAGLVGSGFASTTLLGVVSTDCAGLCTGGHCGWLVFWVCLFEFSGE